MVAVITPPPLVKQTPRTYDSNGGHSSRPAVALPFLAPSPRHQTISTRGGTPLASIVITTTASIATTMLTGLPGPRAHLGLGLIFFPLLCLTSIGSCYIMNKEGKYVNSDLLLLNTDKTLPVQGG